MRLVPAFRARGGLAARASALYSAGPRYFAEIRRLSIAYWLDLDRHEIFDAVGSVEAAH